MKFQLSEMSWPEVYERVKVIDVALIPCGSLEQHGRHMPLGTDTLIAAEVARRVGEMTGSIVLPPVWAGISDHHMDFAGTVTLGADTYVRLVGDLCTSLYRHGFRRILVVNGHGGNTPVLMTALRRIRTDLGRQVIVGMVQCLTLAAQLLPDIAELGKGHADIREASIVALVRGDLLRREELSTQPLGVEGVLGGQICKASLDVARMGKGTVNLIMDTREITASGGWGRVEGASPEIGERIVSTLAAYLAQFVKEMLKIPVGVSLA